MNANDYPGLNDLTLLCDYKDQKLQMLIGNFNWVATIDS